MDCDMCGREQATLKASVEGTVLSVCETCSGYGKVMGRITTAAGIAAAKKEAKKGREGHAEQAADEEIEVVAADFARLIKQKREELGRKQEDGFMKLEDFAKLISVKESVLHKMETGHFRPDVEEAKRLEKLLGLKLVERIREEAGVVPQPKKDQLTLGDLIKIKKK